MADCTHSTLYVRDGYMQAKPMHKCLFCENDALAARLAEAEALLTIVGEGTYWLQDNPQFFVRLRAFLTPADSATGVEP